MLAFFSAPFLGKFNCTCTVHSYLFVSSQGSAFTLEKIVTFVLFNETSIAPPPCAQELNPPRDGMDRLERRPGSTNGNIPTGGS